MLYIYSVNNLKTLIKKHEHNSFVKQGRGNSCRVDYYDTPCAFDIETSSFEINGTKYGIMYIWQFAIYDDVLIGRTWEEFVDCMNNLSKIMNLKKDNKRIVIWVHNLNFEYQFMHKWLNIVDTFEITGVMNSKKVIRAITDTNIEFRCSYILTNKSLEMLANDLTEHKIKKVEGFDYNLIRNSKTELTEHELQYCINDVLILTAYIEELTKKEHIATMPMTSTGYVRRLAKRAFRDSKDWKEYMKSLKLTEHLYQVNKKTYKGAVVHCNVKYSGVLKHNVDSYDFKSSYPAVMLSEKFPASTPKKVVPKSIDEFEKYNKEKCCMYKITFKNIRLKKGRYIAPVSENKCDILENESVDNGRVVKADLLSIYITDVEYFTYKQCYEWDEISVNNMYVCNKAYLPTDFMKLVFNLYIEKELAGSLRDGTEEAEYRYKLAKALLNALYGMCATRIEYDGDIKETIENYNKSSYEFLYPLWATWITAYAMRNLFSGICSTGDDFIYCDTDSIKILNGERHVEYITTYNNIIDKKLEKACKFHGLDFEKIRGLGHWEHDAKYDDFKAIRAKAYMSRTKDKYKLTMSGVKQCSLEYILNNGGFDFFADGMYIPSEYTGKLGAFYSDDEIKGIIKDYQGNEAPYYEKGYVNLSPVDFTMTLSNGFISFDEFMELIGIRE